MYTHTYIYICTYTSTEFSQANSDVKDAPNKETSAKEPATPRKRSHGEVALAGPTSGFIGDPLVLKQG